MSVEYITLSCIHVKTRQVDYKVGMSQREVTDGSKMWACSVGEITELNYIKSKSVFLSLGLNMNFIFENLFNMYFYMWLCKANLSKKVVFISTVLFYLNIKVLKVTAKNSVVKKKMIKVKTVKCLKIY